MKNENRIQYTKNVQFGWCDICLGTLKESHHHRCPTCRSYHECNSCYELYRSQEASQLLVHPHELCKLHYSTIKKDGYKNKFILSFNGGGIRGIVSIRYFEEILKQVKKKNEEFAAYDDVTLTRAVMDKFDYVLRNFYRSNSVVWVVHLRLPKDEGSLPGGV